MTKGTKHLLPSELSRKVQEEFYEGVKGYSGSRFETTIEPDNSGKARELIRRDGSFIPLTYNRCVKRFGELRQRYELDELTRMPSGTFYLTEVFKRSGIKDLYLASIAESLGKEGIRVTFQTNDHPSYTSLITSFTGLEWRPVELKVPLGYEEKSKVETGSKISVVERAIEEVKRERIKSIEELCEEQRKEFESTIRGLGGNTFRTENYSGPLVINKNGIWKLNSCLFTEPHSIEFVPDFSAYNLSVHDAVGIKSGSFLRGEINVRPDHPRKYLAAMTLANGPDSRVDLETNDKDFIRNSLDVWRRVK